MRHLATSLVLATSLLFVGTALAEARGFSRSGSVTGPAGGVYHSQGGGSCAGGSCSYGGQTTGPYGGTFSRSGSATRTAPGQWTTQGTGTGPAGRSYNRSGSFGVQ
jgi:hypothetical protein